MTKLNFTHLALCLLMVALVGLVATDAMAQQVQFSKMDTLTGSFLTWLKGNPVTAFFTVALIAAGLLAAFNRISWMWVIMICVGAFLAFGASNIVAQLKSIFT